MEAGVREKESNKEVEGKRKKKRRGDQGGGQGRREEVKRVEEERRRWARETAAGERERERNGTVNRKER